MTLSSRGRNKVNFDEKNRSGRVIELLWTIRKTEGQYRRNMFQFLTEKD